MAGSRFLTAFSDCCKNGTIAGTTSADFFVGQVMKAIGAKANPALLN